MTEWILSSTVLCGAMLLLRQMLRGRVNPLLQYSLWAIVMVRLLVPVSLFDSALSVQNVHREIAQTSQLQQVYEAVSAPIPLQSYETVYREVVEEYRAGGVDISQVPEQQMEAQVQERMDTVSVQQILMFAWCFGMAVMAVCLVGSNVLLVRRLSRSRKRLDVPKQRLAVYITDAIESPCLFGLFRPAVYLTAEAAEDARTRSYVLAHETTHYCHGDHIWSVLRAVCLVIHWYNPLVWLAAQVSRQDGELACDADALRLLGEEHRSEYGRTLIGLTIKPRISGALITATTMTGGKRAIRERIVILMKHPKTALITMICIILACCVIVGCTFTGAQQEQKQEQTQEQTQETQPESTDPIVTESGITPEAPEYWMTLFARKDDDTNGYNRALTSVYDNPRDMDLYYFFYHGIYGENGWDHLTDDEISWLEFSLFQREMDVQVMPRTRIDEILMDTFGIDLSMVNGGVPLTWCYAESYDTYYTDHNDAYAVGMEAVTGVKTDGDMVQVSYIPADWSAIMDHGRPIVLEEMVVTLVDQGNGSYRIVSNLPADATVWCDDHPVTEDNPGIPLSAEQIEQVNQAFDFIRGEVDGQPYMAVNPVNSFFACYYTNLGEIDPVEFLRYFSAYGVMDYEKTVTEAEFLALREIVGEQYPFAGIENYQEAMESNMPIHRIPLQAVEAVFNRYTGVSVFNLEQWAKSDVIYLPEYGCYYNFTSDFGPGTFVCIRGTIHDGFVKLYSKNAVLTLVEQEDRWVIHSHIPLNG